MGDAAAQPRGGSYVIWPVIMITIGFFGYIGYLLASMERPAIMSNWNSTRCSILVMFAASYFKPDDDPRTPGEFSTDNFSFCMKSIVHDVMEVVMAPFMDVFSGQASSTNVITEMMNGIREIITAMYDAFLSFIEPFLLKFTAITYQIGIKMQHLRAAFRRANAVALSTIFTGLSFIRGIQNAIDLVIKVVMIILIILVVLVILLFFILFPFIPIILAVIAVIVAVATASVAASAGGMNGTFCFDPSTKVQLESGGAVAISDLTLGTRLKSTGRGPVTTVTDIMKLDGSTSPLYSLNGILVSGSHLVRGPKGTWIPVSDDPRALSSGYTIPVLYCLNTSTHTIPVLDKGGETVWFRDWEEMEEGDGAAHKEWDDFVSTLLGNPIGVSKGSSLIDPGLQVLSMNRGLLRIDEVKMGDTLYLDYEGHGSTRVIGLVQGLGPGSCIAKTVEGWMRTSLSGKGSHHLITDTGLLRIVYSTGDALIVRDMTETGIDQIHKTYDFVLRSLNRPSKNKSASTTE